MNSSTDGNSCVGCEFDKSLNTLRNIPFFSGMPLEPLKALAYFCKRVNYQEGDFLVRQGDVDDKGYCILSGTIKVVRDAESGSAVVKELGEGAFVGGMSLITPTKRLFSLQAGPGLSCMVMPQKLFLPHLAKSPEFATAFYKALARTIAEWEESLLKNDLLGDKAGVSLI